MENSELIPFLFPAASRDGPWVSFQLSLLQASSARRLLDPSAIWKEKPLGFLEVQKSTVPLAVGNGQ